MADASETVRLVQRQNYQFEAFRTLTQSVGAAIPIAVQVFDASGAQLK